MTARDASFETWWAGVTAAEDEPEFESEPEPLRGCPAVGCPSPVSHNRIACRVHWFAIPGLLRERLWWAWEQHGEDSVQYQRALAACLDSLKAPAVAA